MTAASAVVDFATRAKDRLRAGTLTVADLDELVLAASSRCRPSRQRLLYLHTATPNVRSPVIAWALHEPVDGSVSQIEPSCPMSPYANVHGAIIDGWRVVHFPLQAAPFDDREADILGFEFILEKMESADA